MPMDASSLADHSNGYKKCEVMHKWFCFAGQPAPCVGLFPDDVLPCVCGALGDLISALSQVA
jgi:hypothetical protein